MKKILIPLLSLIPTFGILSAQQPVLPSPRQVLWQEMEQIMFLHFAPNTWQNTEKDDRSTPLSRINPDKLDVHQWIDAAESFDAKMILFVAKHTGGFCWWRTESTEYGIKNTSYKNGKGDVLDELAKACFERGMKLGIYIYPGDDTWGAYIGGGGKTADPTKQEGYNRVLRMQWEEVLSRYGNQITEIWFDGSLVVPLEDIVKKYAPHAVVFQGPFADIRWVGNEKGYCPYPNWYTVRSEDGLTGVATAEKSTPDGDMWMPVEADVPLKNHNWFWSCVNEKNLRSSEELLNIYYNTVGRGGMLLLNAAPDTTGLIPAKDMALYRLLGNEMRERFGKSIAETSGNGDTVELRLSKPTTIDHVMIQEDISFGQRIRRYRIEGLVGGKWTSLATGSSVGQKRIEYFTPVKVRAVRLLVTESSFSPLIKRMAIFNAGPVPAVTTTAKNEKRVGELVLAGDGGFEFDLSPYIPMAGQYTLRLQVENFVIRPDEISLWLQGVETPGFISVSPDRTVTINITAHPDMKPGSIAVKGRMNNKYANKPLRLFLK